MTPTPLLSQKRSSVALVSLLLSGLASAVQPSATAAAAAASSVAAASARVDALIGRAPCETQSQCHVVGIGSKPCGGPRSWRAWSEMKTDPHALEAAAEAQTQSEQKANQAEGLASDCMVAPTPSAVCRPNAGGGPKSCELGQGGAESPV